MSDGILNLIKKKVIISFEPPKGEVKKNLCKTVKHMLRNSRDEFLGYVESNLNRNLTRFWSILKLNSKSHTIPDRVSTPISASAFADPGNRMPLRSSAENPREIANLFNSYFGSVFAYDTPPPPPPPPLHLEALPMHQPLLIWRN